MTTRRSLTEGLTPAPAAEERDFVYGREKPAAEVEPKVVERKAPEPLVSAAARRVPITTRCRAELAGLLKRASLERQLDGETPYRTQEIVEEALEAWLTEHRYL